MVEKILDWVEDAPLTQKLVILLLWVAATSIIMFQAVVDPRHQRVQALQQTLQSLTHRVSTIEHGRQLEHLTDEIARLTPQVASQKKRLGLQVSTDRLLTAVSHIAQTVGGTLTSWKPEAPIALSAMEVSQVTLRLDAEGGYYALARFLDQLRSLPKTLIVRSMDFQIQERSPESPEHVIHASFALMGFEATGTGKDEPSRC